MKSNLIRMVFISSTLFVTMFVYNNCQSNHEIAKSDGSLNINDINDTDSKKISHTINLLMDTNSVNTIDLNANPGFTFEPGTMNAELISVDTKGTINADFMLNGKVDVDYTPPLNYVGEDHASILITDKVSKSAILEVKILFKVNSSDTNQLIISGYNQSHAGVWNYVKIKKIGSVDFVNENTKIAISLSDSSASLIGYGYFSEAQNESVLNSIDPKSVDSIETLDINGDSEVYFYFTVLKQGTTQLLFDKIVSPNNLNLGSHDLIVIHHPEIVKNNIIGPATVTAFECSGPFRIYYVDKYGNQWLSSTFSGNYMDIDSSGSLYNNYLFEDLNCVKSMPYGTNPKFNQKTYMPKFYEFYAKLAVDQFGTKVGFSGTPSNITFTNCVNLDGSDAIKLYFDMGSSPAIKDFSYSEDASNYIKVPESSIKSNYIDLTFLYTTSLSAKIFYFKLINYNGVESSTPLIVRVRTADLTGSAVVPGSCTVQ